MFSSCQGTIPFEPDGTENLADVSSPMVRLRGVGFALIALLCFVLVQPWSAEAQSSGCTPQVRTSTSTLEKVRGEVTAITVSLTANGSAPGGDKIVAATFTSVTNGVVE